MARARRFSEQTRWSFVVVVTAVIFGALWYAVWAGIAALGIGPGPKLYVALIAALGYGNGRYAERYWCA